MVDRQRLLWSIATRRQLDRWEPLVAAAVREGFARRSPPEPDIWRAETEHHLLLVAARNLLRVLEHWDQYTQVFNVKPRQVEPPGPSGKRFAKWNPRDTPYDPEAWSNTNGALVTANVSAGALHELLDAVDAEALASRPEFERFLTERPESPWLRERDEWWPKPGEEA